jgi:hypothetical protein
MKQYLIKTSQPEQVVDFFMKIDKKDEGEKNIFTKCFFIDLRMLILKHKIEKVIGRYPVINETHKVLYDSRGFSLFQFVNLLKIINNNYGE